MEANDTSNPNKDKAPIVVHTTPEMANWMHPQTNERKHLMLARAETTRQSYRRLKEKAVRYGRVQNGRGLSMSVLNVMKTARRVPRQKVLDYLNQASDERL